MKRKPDQRTESTVEIDERQHRLTSEKTRSRRKQRTPRQWPLIWRKAVDVFYGNETDAANWFYKPNQILRTKPLDVLSDRTGRIWVMRELDRFLRYQSQLSPMTSWHSCRSLYPSHRGGMLLFRGTTTPAAFLFDHLSKGGDIAGFLKKHPEISADQVDLVFEMLKFDLCQ